MSFLQKFAGDRSGAVTLDWVALTAGIVVISIGITYNLFTGSDDGSINGLINAFQAQMEVSADNIDGAVPERSFPLN